MRHEKTKLSNDERDSITLMYKRGELKHLFRDIDAESLAEIQEKASFLEQNSLLRQDLPDKDSGRASQLIHSMLDDLINNSQERMSHKSFQIPDMEQLATFLKDVPKEERKQYRHKIEASLLELRRNIEKDASSLSREELSRINTQFSVWREIMIKEFNLFPHKNPLNRKFVDGKLVTEETEQKVKIPDAFTSEVSITPLITCAGHVFQDL